MERIDAENDAAQHDTIELQQRLQTQSQREGNDAGTATQQEAPETAAQSLLPCDGGTAAWRLLISAFVFEALLWGM